MLFPQPAQLRHESLTVLLSKDNTSLSITVYTLNQTCRLFINKQKKKRATYSLQSSDQVKSTCSIVNIYIIGKSHRDTKILLHTILLKLYSTNKCYTIHHRTLVVLTTNATITSKDLLDNVAAFSMKKCNIRHFFVGLL